MKLKRKKVGDQSYELIDTEVGDVVATAVKTGVDGRDTYPWDWTLTDPSVEFGASGLPTGGSRATLKDVIDFVQSNTNRYGLTYKREFRDRDAKREQALAEAQAENARVESALAAMVRKLDERTKGHLGYIANRDELIAILQEVTPHLSVGIYLEDERHGNVSVEIKFGLTLERGKL